MQHHTRRDFLKRTGAGAAAASASLLSRGQAANDEARSPSVLIIMCDQLNASCLSCYGGPVPTPNIDRIAREGVQFEQATCPTPFCSPSRAAVVTSRYPHAHGIVANCARGRQDGITPEDITTEGILHEAGYETHLYGKWHLFGDPLPYYPDMYDTKQYQAEMAETFQRIRAEKKTDFMPWYALPLPVEVDPRFQKAVDGLGDRWKDQRFAGFITKMGRLKMPLEDHLDVRVANRTVDRLNALKQKPFMVTCSFVAPHDPNIVPSPYYERFSPEELELPANWQSHEAMYERQWSRRIVADLGEPGLREFLRVYYAMVALIDDQVGRVLEALDATGQADDTVVIFTADHGDMMGGHGMVWKSTSAFFDEVAHIPLLIRYPRKVQPRRSEMAACHTDFMPTLLELTGKPVPQGVQGQSLAPFLTGERDDSEGRPFSFSERVRVHPEARREVAPGTQGSFMIRGEGWKYFRYSPENEFLYHLAEDPGETKNLAGDARHAKRKAELSAAMDRWLRDTGFPV